MRNFIKIIVVSVMLNQIPNTLFAQTGEESVAGRSSLEEIVVTARKRAESLQSTPVAVSAIGQAEIESRGFANISNIDQATPNITFNTTASNSGSSNAAVVFIRGIGQSDFYPQIDPGVGIYLDGVYIARTTGAVLDTVDVKQIEVLRGPQGALYGKNTIGGAINITTREPDYEQGGYLDFVAGDFSRFDVKARFDFPISDSLRTSFSYANLNRDGYYKLLDFPSGQPNGKELGDVDSESAAFRLVWDASESFRLDLSLDWTEKREQSAGSTLIAVASGNSPPEGTSAFIHNHFIAPVTGEPQFTDQFITGDPFTSFGKASRSRSDLDLFGLSLTASWDISENLEVKSITAFRQADIFSDRDGDGSPVQILEFSTTVDQDQFSQELQLSGVAFDGKLNWLLGGFYMEEDIFFDSGPQIAFIQINNTSDVNNETLAAFVHASYEINDRLSVSAGLRWTEDKKSNDPIVIPTGGFTPFAGPPTGAPGDPGFPFGPATGPFFALLDPAVADERTFQETTPSVSLDYQFTENVFAYVSYSEGFKSGGFSQRIAFPRAESPSFDPETVTSFEVGVKFEGFDNRLRLNAAAFATSYEDIQVVVFNQIEPINENAGEADLNGFEIEGIAAPTENLDLSFSIGYIDAEFTELDAGTLIPSNAALAYTPEWTANASIAYHFSVLDGSNLSVRADWSYRSEVFLDALNSPDLLQLSYSLLNLNATFHDNDEKWVVSAGVTNVTDELYIVGGLSDLATTSFTDVTYARPREWYLRLRRNF